MTSPTPTRKSFRNAMVEHMKRHKVTATSLSKATGVSKPQIDKLVQGKSETTNVDDALQIARHFGKSIEGLLDIMPSSSAASEIETLIDSLSLPDQEVVISMMKSFIAKRKEQGRPKEKFLANHIDGPV